MERFAIIGLGQFGGELAKSLANAGADVIAIDRDPDLVEQFRDDVALAVRMDSTDEQALKSHAVHECDTVVVGIGVGFESTALTVAVLKSLDTPHIIARAHSPVQARILRSIGAHDIVNPEGEAAHRWANRLVIPNLNRFLELGPDVSMVHVPAPREFHNKTLEQLQLRREYDVNLVAVKRPESDQKNSDTSVPHAAPVIATPNAQTEILPGDVLILVGTTEALASLPASVSEQKQSN